MKKFIAFISALTIITLSACSKKTEDTNISEPVESISGYPEGEDTEISPSEGNSRETVKTDKASPEKTVTTAAAETDIPEKEEPAETAVFREYKPGDFKNIDINLNIVDGESPFSAEECKISLDTSKTAVSRCSGDDTGEITIPEGLPEEHIDEFVKSMQDYRKFLSIFGNEPYSGLMSMNMVRDGKFYYIMNYDLKCLSGSHCFDICVYDIETGRQEILYSYDETEMAMEPQSMTVVNGELLISFYFPETYEAELYRVDTAKHDLTPFEKKKREDLGLDPYICGISLNRLILTGYDSSTEDSVYYEYDYGTGEFKELLRINDSESDPNDPDRVILSDSDAVKCTKVDNMNVSENIGRYRLETGLENVRLAAVGDNMLAYTDDVTYLYIFDLEKMERYRYDISTKCDNATFYFIGKYLYIGNQFGSKPYSYCLIPDLGALFKYEGSDTGLPLYDGNALVFIGFDLSESDGIVTETGEGKITYLS